MHSLLDTLSGIVGQAFRAQDLPEDLGLVKVSDRPDLAQFQCNGAMAGGKQLQKAPRDVALRIVAFLETLSDSPFAKIEIAGPGFINLTLTPEFLSRNLEDIFLRETLTGGLISQNNETVVLDYGGPNIAKAMHVGHLRSAVIGDSLRRLLSSAGYRTVGDVHMGDWGTHMGMLIGDYVDRQEEDVVRSADLSVPGDITRLMEDMAVRYPKASMAAKNDPACMKRAQDVTVCLQEKQNPYYELWQMIRAVSIIGLKKNYEALGITFDLWEGESSVHDCIAPMVARLEQQGHAVKDQGAVIVPVAQEGDKKEIPPLILYKSDGAVMYGTTDLATIGQRIELYHPSKIIYVVDQRQSLHFEQVFRAARQGGMAPAALELTHAGFGTVNGVDGKPFKTRDGGVMRLEDLLAMGLEKAVKRLEEAKLAQNLSLADRADIAHRIAISAIKFADLQNNRSSDYVFDLDRMTNFEGKTGPYLLYQAVRITSLLQKAQAAHGAYCERPFVLTAEDTPLALLLAEFPEHYRLAIEHYTPHVLCDYVFKLAQTFSSFYGTCHILSESRADLRHSRLKLCHLVHRHMVLILDLLGIAVPARM